jgi:hypothetical protein
LDQSRNTRVLTPAIKQVLGTNAGNPPLASPSPKKTAIVLRNQGPRRNLHGKPQSLTDRRYSLNRSHRPSSLSQQARQALHPAERFPALFIHTMIGFNGVISPLY